MGSAGNGALRLAHAGKHEDLRAPPAMVHQHGRLARRCPAAVERLEVETGKIERPLQGGDIQPKRPVGNHGAGSRFHVLRHGKDILPSAKGFAIQGDRRLPPTEIAAVFMIGQPVSPKWGRHVRFQGQHTAHVANALQQVERILHVIEQPRAKTEVEFFEFQGIDIAGVGPAKSGAGSAEPLGNRKLRA